MATQISQFDVVIVGAGIIGAAIAVVLAEKSDASIAIIDKSGGVEIDSFGDDVANKRTVALGAQAQQLLKKCQVWDQLSVEQCCPYYQMFVWDENSQGSLQFSASESGVEQLGFIVDQQALQGLLQQRLHQLPNVRTFYHSDIEQLHLGQTKGESRIDLADGQQITAHLIVAADGVQSAMRDLAEIGVRSLDYQQLGIVAVINTEQSHQHTAWQRFLQTGPLALLPLSNGDCSIVWSVDKPVAQELQGLSDEQFAIRLQCAMQSRLGEVEMRSVRQAFPLVSRRAEAYVKDKLVLIGDAAHGIHPLAGQGANLGFADIVCLSDMLIGHWGLCGTGSAIPPVLLRRYQRERKLANTMTDSVMTLLDKTFRNDYPAWLVARGLGMSLLDNQAPLKQLLTRKAMGVKPGQLV